MDNTWQLQDAKNKFSQLVDCACREGPQHVTRHGKDAVVVISAETYKQLTRPQTSLVSFFRESPLAGIELELERDNSLPRDLKL